MIRNIVTYIVIILVMCGVFAFYTRSFAYPDDSYQNINKSMYSVDESQAYVESLNYKFDKPVVGKSEDINESFFESNNIDCFYGLLIDDTDGEVLASKNANKRMYPASITKLMVSIIVVEKIEAGELSLSDTMKIDKNYDLTSEGVEPLYLGVGTTMTLKSMLYAYMIESNNYYGLILADNICGSEEAFVALMNEKAASIGATNTHYMNTHGLDNPNHYSTAYDTYLIMKEAYSHEIMRDIDTYSEGFTYSYSNANIGVYDEETTAKPTNLFFTGSVTLPAGFSIKLWKTGTTDGAGSSLCMYVTKNDKYYFVACSDDDQADKSDLYNYIIELLCLI